MKNKPAIIRYQIIFLTGILLAITLPITVFLAQQPQQSKQYAAGNPVTFTPKVIPLTDPEIGNPWRTPIYAGSEEAPPGLPFSETYQRWCWSEVETAQGQYNFSQIDALLAKAKSQGGKAGFRIMPVDTSGNAGSCLPADLRSQVGEPPDWNNAAYMNRAQALITALGKKYDNDPRLGWVEIGPYGNWGEWNLADISSTPMTSDNKQKLIQMSVTAFPHKILLIGTDSHLHDGSGFDAMSYALGLSPKIGLRSDCLGSSDLGGAVDDFTAAPDRWKQSPIVFEYCGGPDLKLSYDQLTKYHAAMIADGDGNLQGYSSYSSADQQQLVTNFKTAGYRFIVDSLTIPSQLNAGSAFTVTSKWSNVNVTPAYLPWNVMMQLRSSNGTIAWQGKSQINLSTFLPTNSGGTDTPVSITDNFTLPTTVTAGSYTVSVQILDPQNYYKPLQLAIQGKQTDGSYSLGSITVAGGSPGSLTQTPNTSPTIVPSFACLGSCPINTPSPSQIIMPSTSNPSMPMSSSMPSTIINPSGINTLPIGGNNTINGNLIQLLLGILILFLKLMFFSW